MSRGIPEESLKKNSESIWSDSMRNPDHNLGVFSGLLMVFFRLFFSLIMVSFSDLRSLKFLIFRHLVATSPAHKVFLNIWDTLFYAATEGFHFFASQDKNQPPTLSEGHLIRAQRDPQNVSICERQRILCL